MRSDLHLPRILWPFLGGFTLALGVSQDLEVLLLLTLPPRTQVRVEDPDSAGTGEQGDGGPAYSPLLVTGDWLLLRAGLCRDRREGQGRLCVCREVTLWAEWLESDVEVGKVLGDLKHLEPPSRPSSSSA